ncbi:stage V sporulation protein AB [Paenibacillus sp. IB182496]|uniref:Stage V sporulation protein AB n=1 Tax=Paenibacillus sabuli TaxID=2772509 RepID=A0A927BWN1_9BACL|nr:stage V sporulation protein AB [Paenibacillus sabuli]MBD2846819.1 stage V sporulation protein AB [Paenibacillus sabuli]
MTVADWTARAFLALLGAAGGLAVGSGLVALLVVFDLIPRLAQLAFAYRRSAWFESALVGGAVFWTCVDFFDWHLALGLAGRLPLAGIGLLDGMFVGMLAAALTEVMNVLPILAKRLRIGHYLVALLLAMVLGKIAGSLFDWLVYQW